jgi:hypothetical protein
MGQQIPALLLQQITDRFDDGANGNGRQVVSSQILDGTITTSGTASWWAAWAPGALLAHGPLGGSQEVAAGSYFYAAPFTVKIPAS